MIALRVCFQFVLCHRGSYGRFVLTLLMLSAIVAQPESLSINATKDISRYVREHGGNGRVFRRDPNVWVYTQNFAHEAGMPIQWSSDELKGVAAVAFRREPEGAEQDCGWRGDANTCIPVMNCVLELYFDRTAHKLPWRENSPVVDFDVDRGFSSSVHHSGLLEVDSPIKASGHKAHLHAGPSPFSDPESGKDLHWQSLGARQGAGRLRTLAYDREIHGRYAYLKLHHGCTGHPSAQGQTLHLQDEDNVTARAEKVLYEIYLPAAWSARAGEVVTQDQEQELRFYKGVWEGVPRGDKP